VFIAHPRGVVMDIHTDYFKWAPHFSVTAHDFGIDIRNFGYD